MTAICVGNLQDFDLLDPRAMKHLQKMAVLYFTLSCHALVCFYSPLSSRVFLSILQFYQKAYWWFIHFAQACSSSRERWPQWKLQAVTWPVVPWMTTRARVMWLGQAAAPCSIYDCGFMIIHHAHVARILSIFPWQRWLFDNLALCWHVRYYVLCPRIHHQRMDVLFI